MLPAEIETKEGDAKNTTSCKEKWSVRTQEGSELLEVLTVFWDSTRTTSPY